MRSSWSRFQARKNLRRNKRVKQIKEHQVLLLPNPEEPNALVAGWFAEGVQRNLRKLYKRDKLPNKLDVEVVGTPS